MKEKLPHLIMLAVLFCIISTENVMAERTRGYYTFDLIEVEKDSQSYKDSIKMQELPNGLPYATCIVDDIFVRWDLHLTHLYLIVENKSNSSIKMHWDESAFINTNNEGIRIIHKGVKFSNKEKEQVPTTIIKNTKLSDIIIPADYANYSDYFKRWVFSTLFGSHREGLNDGKLFKVSLAIESDGVIENYTFNFKLKFHKAKTKTRFTPDNLVEYEEIL